MRGDMAIRELRLMGKKPLQAWVFLLTPTQRFPSTIDPDDMLANGQHPEVYVDTGERISSLDFRFLHGVTVHLQGQDASRLRAAYAQIQRCEPSRLIVSGLEIFHDTEEKTCATT